MIETAKEPPTLPAPIRRKPHTYAWQAWIWLMPALILVLTFFIYPLLNTIWISFYNKDSTTFVGLRNYQRIFTNPELLEILRNNVLWLVLATLLTVGLGLVLAVLVDRIKVESIVKSALFVPMAISFVAAGVIWRFVYAYAPPNRTQIGLLNGILAVFHIPPQVWLINTTINNFALIAVYTWMWTGFCVVILSAALKGIPDDILEAARIDGAGRFSLFWRIMVPMIQPTIAVVLTTMVISILKIFDVVYVMTGGDYHTNVIALDFYQELFNNNNYGLASALAVVLLVTIIPVMYINVRRARAEEALQ
ncbi:carbohydrate ABC transporter permease [Tengunoibacter tsumagoiensis]|uniref:Alpha-glucoside ABC transporter permease n=1 Tax=Tengunoibacter tsumagoiensis TaxID=2014871 RepID=A0A402A3A8_9CHLR|nr:sugar ABC transporter permease [Tengunoibacter tsumagoiensis]GCE13624.1 alpha-glucoside ABC transporter permease [Tengunoibacter tsumagoiensis]